MQCPRDDLRLQPRRPATCPLQAAQSPSLSYSSYHRSGWLARQVSRLMLRPKRLYRATLSSAISSLMDRSLSSTVPMSASISLVDLASSSWTSGRGSEMNESPILYLPVVSSR